MTGPELRRSRRWLRGLAKGTAIGLGLAVVVIATGLFAARFADGPFGPIAGGALRSGPLGSISDASLVGSGVDEIELELVASGRSRTVGSFVQAGQLYIPCDLGFIWRRVPSATLRLVLRVIWSVKSWHEQVLDDDRVVVRFDGRRYAGRAVRIEDPDQLDAMRARVEAAASGALGGLLDEPPDREAIWFFRIDPR